jgi:SsrA-binding protein
LVVVLIAFSCISLDFRCPLFSSEPSGSGLILIILLEAGHNSRRPNFAVKINRAPMPRQSSHETKPKPEKSPRREPTASGQRDAAVNRIASHNYFLLEKFECGVALTGTEAKSVRGGLANLKDSYGLVKDGELWLLNTHIGPYEHGNVNNHAPLRTRKLLMHKEEIRKLIGKTQQKGLTLIPVRMYFKNGKVKVELALAKGKQLWDKRETERRRTADKEARDAIRNRKT